VSANDVFCLDDEQRNLLKDCLRTARAGLIEPFGQFVDRVEASIDAFRRADRDEIYRDAHDALRRLWQLSHDPDPGIGQLRSQVRRLSPRALRYVEDRARIVIPRLFPGDSLDTGFIGWVDRAPGQKVVHAIRVLSAQGARLVPGRRRRNAKRSAEHVEPVILGQTRGAADTKPKSGRPVAEARHMLVANLALDWLIATGSMPQAGRSDHTGFGQLVYLVFDSLHEPGAERALRDHWRQVEESRRQTIRDIAEPA
jgi:hypothetical protein